MYRFGATIHQTICLSTEFAYPQFAYLTEISWKYACWSYFFGRVSHWPWETPSSLVCYLLLANWRTKIIFGELATGINITVKLSPGPSARGTNTMRSAV